MAMSGYKRQSPEAEEAEYISMLRERFSYDPLTGVITNNFGAPITQTAVTDIVQVRSDKYLGTIDKGVLAVLLSTSYTRADIKVVQIDKSLPNPSKYAWSNLEIRFKDPRLEQVRLKEKKFIEDQKIAEEKRKDKEISRSLKKFTKDYLANLKKVERYNARMVEKKLKDAEKLRQLGANSEVKAGFGCIYKFTNIETGKVYIGQSINIRNRIEGHKYQAFKEGGAKFQEALSEYGTRMFTFEIIERCAEEYLDAWEVWYIAKHNSYREGYNSTRGNITGVLAKYPMLLDEFL